MSTGLEQKGPRTGPKTPLSQPEQQAISHRASFTPGGFAVILLNAPALNLASFVSRWGACALKAQTNHLPSEKRVNHWTFFFAYEMPKNQSV